MAQLNSNISTPQQRVRNWETRPNIFSPKMGRNKSTPLYLHNHSIPALLQPAVEPILDCVKPDEERAIMRGVNSIMFHNSKAGAGLFGAITRQLSRLEDARRLEFFEHGILPLIKCNPAIPTEGMENALEPAHSGQHILPPEALLPFSCGFARENELMVPIHFRIALGNGTLVRTTATIGGEEREVFLKGFFSESGAVLAYEQNTNSVHAIRMRNGEIAETEHRQAFKDYSFSWSVSTALEWDRLADGSGPARN